MNDTDLRIELARLDERQKSADDRASRVQIGAERALNLAVSQVEDRRKADWVEIQRRLIDLNGEAARIKEAHASSVSRELFDSKVGEIEMRIDELKGNARELYGKLWLPFVLVGVVAAAIGAAAVKLLIP